jgi:hypothetical protein
MKQRFFVPDTTEHEGKWIRGHRIQCNACQYIEKVKTNTSQTGGAGSDDSVIMRRVQDKFETLGWFVGKREQDDLCPKCAGRTSLSDLVATDILAEVVLTSKPNGSGRDLTREERRIIILKLQDVYVDEATGYSAMWTDVRVARDLNVPIEWVAHLREENFGPLNDNPEVRNLATEMHTLADDVKHKSGEVQRLVANMSTLFDEARKMQSEIQQIAQRMHQLEKKTSSLIPVIKK